MKIKDYELKTVIANFEELKKLPSLDGDIAVKAVAFRVKAMDYDKNSEAARQDVIESFCAKDESGKPEKTVTQNDAGTLISFKFDSQEAGIKCGEELAKIDNSEHEFPDGLILRARIESIKCSMPQMEALLMLATPEAK